MGTTDLAGVGFILQHLSLLRARPSWPKTRPTISQEILPPLRNDRSVRVIAPKHCRGINEIAQKSWGKTRLRGSMRRDVPVLSVFEFGGIGRYFGRVGLIPSLEDDPFRGEWTL